MLPNIGFDTAENGPLKVCQTLSKSSKKIEKHRNAENPVLRLLHGESERVKELQSEAAKADGGSDENSSGGSDKHSSKHGAPAIDGIFKDPIQAADEVRNLGKQTAQNTALESFRYLNLRYKQLERNLRPGGIGCWYQQTSNGSFSAVWTATIAR